MNDKKQPAASQQRDFKREIQGGRTWWSIVCSECAGEDAGCSSCRGSGVKILQICHSCRGNGNEDCQCQGSGVISKDNELHISARLW